ncbi:MAG: S49 family peptidase [Rickettsiaceae bacterium]|nr:S49 family peptidase [Rickettsiaceae bacterium]
MKKKSSNMSAVSVTIQNQKTMNIFEYIAKSFFEIFNSTKKKVAVLRLNGPIGKASVFGSKGLNLENTNKLIEKAFSLSKLSAVILVINSPGGSPVQSELIASRIINLSKEKDIPVYCFIEDVAASGGYWLACAGHEIYGSKSSIVGSIGVISTGFGLTDAISKIGIERRVYTSGKNKSILDPFLPAKKDDIKIITSLQREIHNHFIDYIKSRRGGRLTKSDDLLFNGEFWSGEVASEYGLIDGIDDMYSFIKKRFGKNAKIEYVSPKESWIKKKLNIVSQSFSTSLGNEIRSSLQDILASSKYKIE